MSLSLLLLLSDGDNLLSDLGQCVWPGPLAVRWEEAIASSDICLSVKSGDGGRRQKGSPVTR